MINVIDTEVTIGGNVDVAVRQFAFLSFCLRNLKEGLLCEKGKLSDEEIAEISEEILIKAFCAGISCNSIKETEERLEEIFEEYPSYFEHDTYAEIARDAESESEWIETLCEESCEEDFEEDFEEDCDGDCFNCCAGCAIEVADEPPCLSCERECNYMDELSCCNLCMYEYGGEQPDCGACNAAPWLD